MGMIGLLYIVLIFAVCLAIVLFMKLALLGLKSLKKKPEPKPPAEKKPEKKPEPVYYIVEKKRAKRSSYSAPKEIKFKD